MGSAKDEENRPEKEVERYHSTSPSELERQLSIEIGKRITQVRGELTQKEFARPIGLNFGSIGKYERGLQSPGAGVLNKICEIHGINHQWLLTGEGPMRKGEAPAPLEPASSQPAKNPPIHVAGPSERVIVPMKTLFPDSLPFDSELLEGILVEMEEYLTLRRATIPAKKKAQLLTMLYEQHINKNINKADTKSKDQVSKLLGIVL